ncbi:hypothetical protein Ocin01_12116 [Orchesella cincta]|uniref:Uncharacterized protein n=1 Tax=Orchesella cincta TaxID=48709 RepID=A0A1D2MNF0_ORCCI|nr:hypothetical protein Ocin01_12116 [Orchesella cincta]
MKNKPGPKLSGRSSTVSLRSTPSAKKRRKERRKAKQQKSEDVLEQVNKPPPYKFVDTTLDLGEESETLEIYPTKSAPTVADIEDDLAREHEKEKLKFFNVPIKIYDPDKDAERDEGMKRQETTELNRYGSRVIMNTEGHVIGMEVRTDLIKDTKRKNITTEICQCIEREYGVSEGLKSNRKVRRRFMARVLFIEAAFRTPSILFYIVQSNFEGLHDFLYQQNLLTFFIICIIQGTRIASVMFSDIGRYEPCLTIITVLTVLGHSLLLTLLTAIMQSVQMYFTQYEEFEDPTSLLTVNIKKKTTEFSYPYCFCMGTAFQLILNCLLGSILMLSKKRMAEFGNSFLAVLAVATILWAGTCLSVVIFANHLVGIRVVTSWDFVQVVAASVCVCKWCMWRFFMLQELLRGKVTEVKETYHHVVALNFAI